MAFNSLQFWFYFPIIFLMYWMIPIKFNSARKIWLICVSYLLYMNWKPAFAIVLLGVTLITFFGGRILGKKEYENKKKKLVWFFVICGTFPLFVFKYYDFINTVCSNALSFFGIKCSLSGLNWAIPIGISFFTFQALGYMLDVYHKRIEPEENIVDYILFVSFFPYVTSGPISKAEELLPQIKTPHKFEYSQGIQGLKFLLWGMFLKLVIADRSGIFVDMIFSHYENYYGSTCFVASILYTIQIYCDFAGYSFMAIGLSRTLGFKLIENFKRPYLSVGITDFWKRWHISLTRWLTQQVYFPLGGNRCSRMRCNLNIMVTFLVSGIWHGANWTFIFWGAIHGLMQLIEKNCGWGKNTNSNIQKRVVKICFTFLLVNFAWIFFRMPSISDSFGVIGRIFSNFGIPEVMLMGLPQLGMLSMGLVVLLFKELREEFFSDKMLFLNACPVRWMAYVILFCMILSIGVLDGGQFIYASF